MAEPRRTIATADAVFVKSPGKNIFVEQSSSENNKQDANEEEDITSEEIESWNSFRQEYQIEFPMESETDIPKFVLDTFQTEFESINNSDEFIKMLKNSSSLREESPIRLKNSQEKMSKDSSVRSYDRLLYRFKQLFIDEKKRSNVEEVNQE